MTRNYLTLAVLATTLSACGSTPTSPTLSTSSTSSTTSSNTPAPAPTPTPTTARVRQLTVEGAPFAEAGAGPYQFVALATFTNGTITEVTTQAVWTTSNSGVATFTSFAGRPVLYTYRTGTITVTATYGGKSATLSVTVF